MGDFVRDETRRISHVILIITVTLFSIILILLDVVQGWEMWTIPVMLASVISCFVMHVSGKPGEQERIYLYTAIICIQLFYYTVKIELVYNCVPISILIIMLLSLTKERRTVWAGALSACAGLLIRMFPSGTAGWILWYIGIILLAGFIMTRFLSEARRNEEGYRKYIAELLKQNKSADDFLANVSHEIRTPVNAVIGLTGVSLEKEEDPDIRENLKMVSEAGHRLSEQISDILDYSEIERRDLAVNMEDYRISTVIKDLVEELRVFSNPDVELIFDIDPAIPSVMRTDTLKLRRILWHVISNGFKYTVKGSVYVRISTSKQDYGVNLRIDVWDTGVGMTESERERIYEHFFQSDSGRSRTSSGLGLGMSIAKGFTEALEGFISVSSASGEGTRVRICIPQTVVNDTPFLSFENSGEKIIGGLLNLERYENPIVREAYNRAITNGVKELGITMHRVDNINHLKVLREKINFTHLFVSEEEYIKSRDYLESAAEDMLLIVLCGEDFVLDNNSKAKLMRKPFTLIEAAEVMNSDRASIEEGDKRLYLNGVKILVVDDEPMNLMVADNILNRYGIEVTKASSGMEAVDCCMRNSYDVIFMDYMMPKMDGIETARKIRAIRGDSMVPNMVAFTANAVSTAKETFYNEGFVAFLSKPIEANELERVLRAVLPESVFSYRKIEKNSPAAAPQKEESVEEFTEVPEAGNTEERYEDFARLEEKGVNTEKGMDYCLKDRDMYISVLTEYRRDAENKIRDLEEYFDAENWDEFVIRIHSVKSSSLMIGAEKLSRKAKLLEEAAKDRNVEYVREMYPAFLPEYRKVVELIGDLYDDTQV